MGLSRPHFIFSPKGKMSSRTVPYSDGGQYMCTTLVGNRVRISLLSVFFAVRVAFIADLVVGHIYSTCTLAW